MNDVEQGRGEPTRPRKIKTAATLGKIALVVALITGGQQPAPLVTTAEVAATARPAAVRMFAVIAVYAFQSEDGRWHGEPDLLPAGRFRMAPTLIPFTPADKYNPLAGQTLTVRYGEIGLDADISVCRLQVRQDDGSPLNLPVTRGVQDSLFGPPISDAPGRQQWEATREQRRRDLDGTS